MSCKLAAVNATAYVSSAEAKAISIALYVRKMSADDGVLKANPPATAPVPMSRQFRNYPSMLLMHLLRLGGLESWKPGVWRLTDRWARSALLSSRCADADVLRFAEVMKLDLVMNLNESSRKVHADLDVRLAPECADDTPNAAAAAFCDTAFRTVSGLQTREPSGKAE
ncbi:hypothetical protein BV25DRAFT_1840414 [Artomyces pyxidatus]|uniref:Uncharacterized protein n=1 Tax=Artomyces pyxidatus TaxID=48021 RepID=A0ACB8SU41_9AGAM|nr:hypothetical protein BV25DRAFT_1840414 [Artomyces pyxidatus]